MTPLQIIFLVVAVLFGLYLLNKTAFRRAGDVASAQVGKLARGIWAKDPIALKNREIDREAENIAEARKGLEKAAGLQEAVANQVATGKKESARLEAKASQAVKNGNDDLARDLLLQKKKADIDVANNEQQLKTHTESYEVFLEKFKSASRQISNVREEAKRQGIQLQMAKAEAELSALQPSMNKSLSFDRMEEIDAEIESQINASRGKGRVANDLAKEGLEESRLEEQLLRSQADKDLEKLKDRLKSTHEI